MCPRSACWITGCGGALDFFHDLVESGGRPVQRRHGLIDRGPELLRLVLLERLADCGQRPGPIAGRHAGGVDGMLEPGPACQASGQEKGSLDSRQRIIDPGEYSGRNRVAARQTIESHVQLRRP